MITEVKHVFDGSDTMIYVQTDRARWEFVRMDWSSGVRWSYKERGQSFWSMGVDEVQVPAEVRLAVKLEMSA